MPELPEVETIVRDLSQHVLLKQIKAVKVNDPFVLKALSIEDIHSALVGKMLTQIYRRGKAVVFVTSRNKFFVVQPMMTGQLVFFKKDETVNLLKETRIEIVFSDGSTVLYNDQRRFGHLRIVVGLDEIKYFQVLGPEPLGEQFTVQYLKHRIRGSNRPIKNILLDHTIVAGIGNIYASEILFRAKISPIRKGQSINVQEIERLVLRTKEVLQLAIEYRGSSMRNYRDGRGEKGRFNQLIQVYAREQEPCPICAYPIQRIVQAGRSTFYCRKCQK